MQKSERKKLHAKRYMDFFSVSLRAFSKSCSQQTVALVSFKFCTLAVKVNK